MSGARHRIEVMHGVNLDQLGKRNPLLYGTLTLAELEQRIEREAAGLEMDTGFFHTNHEGAFVEHLHSLRDGDADAILINTNIVSDIQEAQKTVHFAGLHLLGTSSATSASPTRSSMSLWRSMRHRPRWPWLGPWPMATTSPRSPAPSGSPGSRRTSQPTTSC